ncbi:LysR family transcriptional regulator [Staphylococcus saprophyticus]|nr:LysR family transcriptional regulator [Staphylococcus saprophyticus]MDW4023892.1 LysR family transcriptional regulator [Staphylococcus saprophyticus]
MSVIRFEILSKVVELESFTLAAEKMNMTQSAVSHAVTSLEKELDTSLLIRGRRKGITLTEVGQKVLPHMREVLKRMDSIHQEITLSTHLEAGMVRIGTFASASSCLLPKLLSAFQKRHPKIDFKFYEGTYEEIVEWLDSGIIDAGFVVKGKKDIDFDLVPLIEDQMVIAFHPTHTFGSQGTVNINDLEAENFIMPTGMYQSHVEEIFESAKISPKTRLEVHDCTTIANMVQEGLGVTIGPELFLKTQSNIKLRQLNIKNKRVVALACPSIESTSPAVQEFLKVAENVFK